MYKQNKFTIIITTRCDLRCKLCCEYVPQNKPFADISLEECKKILDAYFNVVDYVETLHLSGGGEPFLHKELDKLISACMKYDDRFGRLMLFTNSTINPGDSLLETINKYKDRIVIQVSHYGIRPEIEKANLKRLEETGANIKFVKYYGEDQAFGGWVDFGEWVDHNDTIEKLSEKYSQCAVVSKMDGNWRTRNGRVHICSRSQRGTELGLIPVFEDDFVDLFDESSIDEKRAKFDRIRNCQYINACRYCSGDQGTDDAALRHPAAEQI